jgi:phosphoserine phosphatase RsbU/P
VDVLRRLNDLVLRDETDRYCTVILARVRRQADGSWEGLCASGGHPPALLRTPSGSTTPLQPWGQVVGLVTEAEFASVPVTLRPGDTLLLYTDGVTDGRNPQGFFGEERLVDTVAAAPPAPAGLVDSVLRSVLAFQDDHASDDIACLAVGVVPGC